MDLDATFEKWNNRFPGYQEGGIVEDEDDKEEGDDEEQGEEKGEITGAVTPDFSKLPILSDDEAQKQGFTSQQNLPIISDEDAKKQGFTQQQGQPDFSNLPIISDEEAKSQGLEQREPMSQLKAAAVGAGSAVVPMLTAIPAMKAGQIAGTAGGRVLGGALGLATGPAAPFVSPVLSFVGGLGGAILGGYIGEKIQDAAAKFFGVDKAVAALQQQAQEEWPKTTIAAGAVPWLGAYGTGLGAGTRAAVEAAGEGAGFLGQASARFQLPQRGLMAGIGGG